MRGGRPPPGPAQPWRRRRPGPRPLPDGRLPVPGLQLPNDRLPGRPRGHADGEGGRPACPPRRPGRPLQRPARPTSSGWASPAEPADGVHGWQAYVCLYRPEAPNLAHVDALHTGRNALMAHLGALGIETRPGTHAVHMLDFYRESMGTRARDCPGAWVADRASFALPLFPTLTEAEQDEVVAAIRAFDPGRVG
ncbi:MAG: DegT/DnrJ/EryC1/StrS family aminotransferase [bacterium]